MPFKKYPIDNHENFNPINKDELAIFLIPGVFESGDEFTFVVEQLINNSKHSVYVYMGPRHHRPDKYVGKNPDFNEQAERIANAIERALPQFKPCLIVGYSHGCTLSVLAAQYLKRKYDREAFLYLIDAATPDITFDYFSNQSAAAKKDLINIAKYAESLSFGKNYDISDEKITNEKLPLIDYILELKNIISSKHEVAATKKESMEIEELEPFIPQRNPLETFAIFIEMWLQDLQHLQEYKKRTASIHTDLEKLALIKILFTKSTAEKLGHDREKWDGGWGEYAKEIILENDPLLIFQDHSSLLSEENATNIANAILDFCRNDISISNDRLLFLHVQYLLAQIPTESNVKRVLEKAKDEMSISLSPPSDSPTSSNTPISFSPPANSFAMSATFFNNEKKVAEDENSAVVHKLSHVAPSLLN